MTLPTATTLFLIMIALAAIPSASVLLVVTQSATRGLRHGLAAAAGIVVADLLFVLAALYGMHALARSLGDFFLLVRIAGGLYLIFIGAQLIRRHPAVSEIETGDRKGSIAASGLAGFFLTLGDIKAIFFYASLFPDFVEVEKIGNVQILVILLVTVLAVGGIKALYALGARTIHDRYGKSRHRQVARSTTGIALIGTGGYLIAKS